MNAPPPPTSSNNDQHRRTATFSQSKFNDSELIRRSFLLNMVDIQRQRRTPSPTDASKSTSKDLDRPPNHSDSAPRLSRRRQSMHNRRGSVETTWGDGDGRRLPLPSLPFSTKAGLRGNNNHRHPRRRPPSHSRERGDLPTPNNSSSAPTTTHPPSTSRHNKLQRRSSHTGITAGFAQEMIAEMVSTNTNKAKIDETAHDVKQTSSHHHGPRRRVTVSHHAPSNLQLQEQLRQSQEAVRYENNLYKAPSSSSPLKEEDQEEEPTTRHMGFRSDYTLGEYSRHPSHMIIPQTTACIDTLGRYDFAFVKRSNGTYSYSILAYRTNSTDTTRGSSSDIHDEKGECMAFVIDDIGSTKIINKKYWKNYIRLVASEEQSHQDHHPLLLPVSQGDHSEKKKNVVFCQEIPVASCQEMPHNNHRAQEEVNHDQDHQEEDECDELPDMIVFIPQENHDECSLISSVSDKARMKWRR